MYLAPPPAPRAGIWVLLSDLLASGGSVHNNPKSSAVEEAAPDSAAEPTQSSHSLLETSVSVRSCWDQSQSVPFVPPKLH